jgi:serine/threonine-protein kinase
MSDYPPNQLIPGTVYQVVQLLGQGGMGTVYEVEDTTVGKRYVLKTLHAQLRDRRELADRLNIEARVLAKLSHPNIVEVVTAGMTADALKLPYFVMQKLSGHTLRSVLAAKGRLPLETAYSIAIDLLDALDHAHAAGVIHRDVKPENIFLHRGPNDAHQTKLLDFGVMRLLSGDEPQTGARFVGTLRYAPPEQLRGVKVTPRTDLYAAGLVLYEMVAGGGPFDEETTDKGIANAHMNKSPPPLARKTAVPGELEELVASALAKSPDARPKDAFTFASRLRALARDAASARARSSQPGKTVEPVLGGMEPPSATNLNEPTDVAAPVPSATTTGATESLASESSPTRRTTGFVVGMAALGTVVVGMGVGVVWMRGRNHATAIAPAAATTATASPTASPTATATATSNPTPTPTLTATATPVPRPVIHRPAAPPPAPTPSLSASAKPRLPGPGF